MTASAGDGSASGRSRLAGQFDEKLNVPRCRAIYSANKLIRVIRVGTGSVGTPSVVALNTRCVCEDRVCAA